MKKSDWNILKDYGITKDNLTVGGYLDLRGTAITSLPDNLTIGGGLYLRGTAITSLPDNLTVGGGLDLEGTAITSLPDNLTIGGGLYLRGTAITNPNNYKRPFSKMLSWRNGKYIKVDGMFTEVVHRKGNVFKVKRLNTTKEFYLVTDGKYNFAHGDTLKEAKEDLRFKVMAEQLKNEPILPDTVVTVKHYRLITGACEFGVKDWMQRNEVKEGLTAKELLPILERTNAYGLDKFKSLVKF